ncbi:MAG: hypothetical protein ACM3WP_22770 [Acidobacteriota bacterium]
MFAISGKLLFAASGVGAYRPLRPGDVQPWENIDEARKAYAIALKDGTEDLPLRTATIWQQLILKRWQGLYQLHPETVMQAVEVEHGGVTTAYFAGRSGLARPLQLVQSRVSFALSAAQPFSAISEISSECWNRMCALGTLDVAKEYLQQSTDRARREWEQWTSKAGPYSGPEGKVRAAIRVVDLTIAYHKGDQPVGPPIDAAEITADGSIHWVARKDQCPAE